MTDYQLLIPIWFPLVFFGVCCIFFYLVFTLYYKNKERKKRKKLRELGLHILRDDY